MEYKKTSLYSTGSSRNDPCTCITYTHAFTLSLKLHLKSISDNSQIKYKYYEVNIDLHKYIQPGCTVI